MNGKDILNTVESITNESGLDKNDVFNALALSLAVAAKKDFPSEHGKLDFSVEIDQKTGSYTLFRQWTVVDDNELNFDSDRHLYEDQAEEKYNSPFPVGHVITEKISEDQKLSRIAAQVFKQSIKENIRSVIKNNAQQKYKDKVGEVFKVKVSRFSKGDVIVSLNDSVDGIIKRESLQYKERLEMGKVVDVVLEEIVDNYKGQQLIFDRTSDSFVKGIIEREIPEIQDESVEIKGFVRNKGRKTIVAVKSIIPYVDAVAVCIGARASRIKNIREIVGGEIIEVVLWDADETTLLLNLLKERVSNILFHEKTKEFEIGLKTEAYDKIKNIKNEEKFLSDLTGTNVHLYTESGFVDKQNKVEDYFIGLFSSKLNIDSDFAGLLYDEGFDDFEIIAYTSIQDYLSIDGLDEDIASEIKSRAVAVLESDKNNELLSLNYIYDDIEDKLKHNCIDSVELLAKASVEEVKASTNLRTEQSEKIINEAKQNLFKEAYKLSNIEEINEDIENALKDNNINNIEDLAYLSTFELEDILKLDEKDTVKIITKAKNIFFSD